MCLASRRSASRQEIFRRDSVEKMWWKFSIITTSRGVFWLSLATFSTGKRSHGQYPPFSGQTSTQLSLTIHEDGPDEFHVSFVQVSSALSVTEDGLGQLCKLLEPGDEKEDSHFAFLRNLHFLHLSDLSRLGGKKHGALIQYNMQKAQLTPEITKHIHPLLLSGLVSEISANTR